MENPIEKSCLVNSHDEGYITAMCIDNNCKYESRILCNICMLEKQHNHSNCTDFLFFKSINASEVKLNLNNNKKSYDIQRFLDDLNKYELDMCLKIEQEFNFFLKHTIEKIIQTKKDLKQQIQTENQEIKNQMANFLKKQEEIYDLSQIQQEINKFKQRDINNKQLNTALIKKSKQIPKTHKFEEIKLVSQYKEIKKKHFHPEVLQFQQIEINKIVESVSVFQKLSFEQKLYQYKNLQLQLQKVNWDNNIVSEYKGKQKNVYEVTEYTRFFSLQKFSKTDQIKFKFQYNCKIEGEQSLTVGIASKEQEKHDQEWYYTGNQINLEKNCDFKRPFKNTGILNIEDVLKDGQILEIFVHVQENIFIIQTEDKQFIMESDCQLEQDIQNWHIIFEFFENDIITIL